MTQLTDLKTILLYLQAIFQNQGVIINMSQELKDAVAALADEVATEIAELAAALAAASPTVDPDVAASVAKLKDLTAQLKASGAPAVEPTPVEPTV